MVDSVTMRFINNDGIRKLFERHLVEVKNLLRLLPLQDTRVLPYNEKWLNW